MDYLELAKIYEKLESTTKRLDKTYIISKLLSKAHTDDIPYIINLLQGRVFPIWDSRKLGFSSRLILKAISLSTGSSPEHVEKLWAEKGDLGIVAESLIHKKKQTTLFSKKLTVKKVYDNLQELAKLEGEGAVAKKISLVSELLTAAISLEAKFIVRTVLEQLRVGVAQGILRDAIAWAYFPKVIGIFFKCNECSEIIPNTEKCLNCNKIQEFKFKEEVKKQFKNSLHISKIEDLKNFRKYDFIITEDEKLAREIYNSFMKKVQDTYNLCNDFVETAISVKENKEVKIKISLGTPINPMLAVRADTLDEAFEALGKPLLVEYKLDGFRLQIHKDKNKYWFYTRRLENVLNQFKELIDVLNKYVKSDSYILDCEVIGYDSKSDKYLPFQNMSQRIKRKYDIEKIAKEVPVEINVFDILYLDGKTLLHEPQQKRRKIIEKIIKEEPKKIVIVKGLITDSIDEVNKFYKKSLRKGNEGIMLKNLHKEYNPGRLVEGWIKFKPNLEPLDLVITGATYGEGKRAAYLSSYLLSCQHNGKLLECGMSSSGLKEKKEKGFSYDEMTKLLIPLITKKEARIVKVRPKIIVEVLYEEIQKSPTYSSGYALRFPRITRLRTMDKPLKDIATLKDIENIYNKQRGRKK